MESKATSHSMQALLTRLETTGYFNVVVFPEHLILELPVTQWPRVQCLISFFSSGFPLEKAIEYVKLVQPVEINRLESQRLLRNR